MPVAKPGKVLLTGVPLKFVAKKVAGGHGKALDAAIPLVPFIDFLITLVVFLLSSFGAELLQTQPNLTMPSAVHTGALDNVPVLVAINRDVVTLDGARVADTHRLAENAMLQPIDEMVQRLEQARRTWSLLHPTEPFRGELVLQADVSIDYRVIKKVMFSAAQAGYSNISFAVNRQAAGGS